MSTDELACTYAALILHDEGLDVTAEKITTITRSSGLEVEAFYPTLFAQFLDTKPMGGLLSNVGGAGGAPADAPAAGGDVDAPAATGGDKKAAAPAEESEDGDMGFGLFD